MIEKQRKNSVYVYFFLSWTIFQDDEQFTFIFLKRRIRFFRENESSEDEIYRCWELFYEASELLRFYLEF